MRVALTNDDGIFAIGLRSLYTALVERGHHVDVFAPLTEQSGVSRSVTVHTPLQIRSIQEESFRGTAVLGTPTDCVKLSVSELLEQKPDVFLSGINLGSNIGPDILYSGTVGAAAEAAAHDISALAISSWCTDGNTMLERARYAVSIMESLPWDTIPKRRVMNLNLPQKRIEHWKGLKLCNVSNAIWKDWYIKREDNRSRPYWWLDGTIEQDEVHQEDDVWSLKEGFVTLTPLQFSFTDDGLFASLQDFVKKIEKK